MMRGLLSWQFLSELFPPSPHYTEKDIPDLFWEGERKVYFVTGGAIGVGYELVKILYSKNSAVYIAGRTESTARTAIQTIKAEHPESTGRLDFQYLDLSDITTIKPAVENFLGKEERLDVLFNNAGIMVPPVGSTTKQGYELQLGTNAIGHFVLLQHLNTLIQTTSTKSPRGAVRIIWVCSSAVHSGRPGGIDEHDPNNHLKKLSQLDLYSASKIGCLFLAAEYSRRNAGTNVVSVALNPGSLKTQILRHTGSWMRQVVDYIMMYPPVNGAYTELWAALSPDVTVERSGSYIIPWGRFGEIKPDLVAAQEDEDNGGTGRARRFWDYCESETKGYM